VLIAVQPLSAIPMPPITVLEKIPNFNLNGDRGYGWKTWEAADPVASLVPAPARRNGISHLERPTRRAGSSIAWRSHSVSIGPRMC